MPTFFIHPIWCHVIHSRVFSAPVAVSEIGRKSDSMDRYGRIWGNGIISYQRAGTNPLRTDALYTVQGTHRVQGPARRAETSRSSRLGTPTVSNSHNVMYIHFDSLNVVCRSEMGISIASFGGPDANCGYHLCCIHLKHFLKL